MPAMAVLLAFFWLGLLGVTIWAWLAAGVPTTALLPGGTASPAAVKAVGSGGPPGATASPVALVYTQAGLTHLLTDVGKTALVVAAILALALGLAVAVGRPRESDS